MDLSQKTSPNVWPGENLVGDPHRTGKSGRTGKPEPPLALKIIPAELLATARWGPQIQNAPKIARPLLVW